MAKLFELEGAHVAVANDGHEALKKLETQSFDLVLSDIGMPGMDGYELVVAIRKHPRLSSLPAVALTGFGRESDVKHAMEAGFNAHLSKPVAVEDVIRLFGKLRKIDPSRSRETARSADEGE
jgi:two-component system CheB/CheR fusion protein